MNFNKLVVLGLFFLSLPTFAQDLKLATDTLITTQHQIKTQNETLSYTAEAGMLPVYDSQGKALASLHYTYYYKNEDKKGKQEKQNRPLLISFNGGPGSASAWMHLAFTGPKLLQIDDEGYPIQPYGIKDNPYTLLDIADIVYVNPVNTGYSRIIKTKDASPDRNLFFGINADINYLADWLNTFVTRKNKWTAAKYLIGESYGGTRVSGLAYALQQKQWMYLNGVILVSPADYLSFESDTPLSNALFLPYYTATAWYHNQLPSTLQEKKLEELLPVVEDYAMQNLLPALAMGNALSKNKKDAIAKQLANFTGIDKEEFLAYELALPSQVFWKKLLKDQPELSVGRLDSRYKGLDKYTAGEKPDYNSELIAWLQAFTPAINYYMQEELQFKTNYKYNMFGPVHPWDRNNNQTREQLRKAMAQNPFLHVLYQTGIYDGATTYFHSKYSMRQLDPSGNLKNRINFKTYLSGHMMYLREQDLIQSTRDLREFILKTSTPKKAARYD